MKRYLVISCAALSAACASTPSAPPIDTPDATTPDAADASPALDAADSTTDGAADGGSDAIAMHVHARDLAIMTYWGPMVGSHVAVRTGPPPTEMPRGSCDYRSAPGDGGPPLETIVFGGVTKEYTGYEKDGMGIDGWRALARGIPAPIPGSTLDLQTTLVGGPTPFLAKLRYGDPSRNVEGSIIPPDEGPTLTDPTALPKTFDADLTVAWSPAESDDVYVEIELGSNLLLNHSGERGTLVCRPETGGSLTVPYVPGRPPKLLRISVLRYALADVTDDMGTRVSVLAERGTVLAPSEVEVLP